MPWHCNSSSRHTTLCHRVLVQSACFVLSLPAYVVKVARRTNDPPCEEGGIITVSFYATQNVAYTTDRATGDPVGHQTRTGDPVGCRTCSVERTDSRHHRSILLRIHNCSLGYIPCSSTACLFSTRIVVPLFLTYAFSLAGTEVAAE